MQPVARVFDRPVPRRGLRRFLPGTEASLARDTQGAALFILTRDGRGATRMTRLPEGGPKAWPELAEGMAALWPGPHTLRLSFTGCKEEASTKWDLMIDLATRLIKPESFLEACGLALTPPNGTMTVSLLESWCSTRLRPLIVQSVQQYTLVDLRQRDSLPASWWQKQIGSALGECGMDVVVQCCRWQSADAERQEQEAKRAAEIARIAEASARETRAREREAEEQAKHEARMREIKANVRLSEAEKDHQSELQARQYQKALLDIDIEVESTRMARERAAAEHAVAVAILNRDFKAVEMAEVRAQDAERRHETAAAALERAAVALQSLAEQAEPLLTKLAAADARTAFQTAERLVSQEFGFTSDVLDMLGFDARRQLLVESVRQKAAADADSVRLTKVEIRSRDIGTRRVPALAVNTPLSFELQASRAGYVTVLNVGTSGRTWLHVPSAYVKTADARIVAGAPAAIPGSALLPWNRLRAQGLDYLEVGPPGWEHLLAVVSDNPLIEAGDVGASNDGSPFALVSPEAIAAMIARLQSWPAESWSGACLSFVVV